MAEDIQNVRVKVDAMLNEHKAALSQSLEALCTRQEELLNSHRECIRDFFSQLSLKESAGGCVSTICHEIAKDKTGPAPSPHASQDAGLPISFFHDAAAPPNVTDNSDTKTAATHPGIAIPLPADEEKPSISLLGTETRNEVDRKANVKERISLVSARMPFLKVPLGTVVPATPQDRDNHLDDAIARDGAGDGGDPSSHWANASQASPTNTGTSSQGLKGFLSRRGSCQSRFSLQSQNSRKPQLPSSKSRFGSMLNGLFNGSTEVQQYDDVVSAERKSHRRQSAESAVESVRSKTDDDDNTRATTRKSKIAPYSVVAANKGQERPSLTLARMRRLIHTKSAPKGIKVIHDVIKHPIFDMWCGFVILANSIMIGAETQYDTQHDTPSEFFSAAQMTFNFWYLLEVLSRMLADGVDYFTSASEWRWNMFDMSLVLISLLEVSLQFLNLKDWTVMGRFLRTLRVLRVVRTLRIVRVLRYIREFRKMIFAIAASLQTLFWSLLLLGIIMYMFAVCFTQGVAEWLKSNEQAVDEDVVQGLQDMYGSLDKTVLHLYMSISGGISWGLCTGLLEHVHWAFVLFFLAYVSVSVFGVLNVVTSVFVESAMQSSNHYRDLLVQEKLHQKELYAKHMREVFRQIDVDDSGQISAEEMEVFLSDENLRLYLEALDVDLVQSNILFKLLDHDESGQIDIDEFCEGCLRLKGEAKAFDIHCLLYENQRMLNHWTDFMQFVEYRLDGLYPDPEMESTATRGKSVSSGGQQRSNRSIHNLDVPVTRSYFYNSMESYRRQSVLLGGKNSGHQSITSGRGLRASHDGEKAQQTLSQGSVGAALSPESSRTQDGLSGRTPSKSPSPSKESSVSYLQ